jgi:hypothetical protein
VRNQAAEKGSLKAKGKREKAEGKNRLMPRYMLLNASTALAGRRCLHFQ